MSKKRLVSSFSVGHAYFSGSLRSCDNYFHELHSYVNLGSTYLISTFIREMSYNLRKSRAIISKRNPDAVLE